MNIEMIKQVISDYLPDDIIVSKINVTENAGKLMVEISWDLKDSKPEFTTPVSTSRSATPISDAINTPEFKRKVAEELATYPGTVIESSNDLNKFIKALDGLVKALEPGEYQKYKNIIIDGYCKPDLISFDQPISLETTGLSGYCKDKWKKELEKAGCVSEQKPSIPYKKVMDKVVATKGSDKYIDGLIRAGINPERAREMAGQAAGEIISGIDWAKPILETKTATTNTTTENPTGLVPNQSPGSIAFRRTEPDGYAVIGEDGKLVERKRFAKKSSEVIDEYTNAVKSYAKRFHVLGKLPRFGDKGKHNMASCVPHELSNPDRKITDVEVMLLTNQDFLNPTVDAIETDLKKITAEFNKLFNSAKTEQELRDVCVDIFGRTSTNLILLTNQIPDKYKVELGNKIDAVRAAVDLAFNKRLSEIRKDNPTTLIKCKQIFSHIKDIGKIIFK